MGAACVYQPLVRHKYIRVLPVWTADSWKELSNGVHPSWTLSGYFDMTGGAEQYETGEEYEFKVVTQTTGETFVPFPGNTNTQNIQELDTKLLSGVMDYPFGVQIYVGSPNAMQKLALSRCDTAFGCANAPTPTPESDDPRSSQLTRIV